VGHIARMWSEEEKGMQGFGREALEEETTWKKG
jgi:hypothetical protein